MSPSIWQILIVGAVALLLFGGRGKISSVMGDLAKGIKSFKKGLKEEEPAISDAGETIDGTVNSKETSNTK